MPPEDEAGRVLIVEDDPALRRAVSASMAAAGFETATAESVEVAWRRLDEFRPDLVVLDVRLPEGREGFEFGRRIRASSETPIIFLTAVDGVEERLNAFALGADDYLAKPFSMPELLARSQAILRRSRRRMAGVIVVGDLEVNLETGEAHRDGARVALTGTEFRLLVCLARQPGQVFSKVQLLSEVWQFDAYDVNLVEVYISSLRKKLEALGPRLIFTERAAGYVLRA